MLIFQEVTKQFNLIENTVITPVNRVTLDIKKGELVIIVGRSGTGKTTLLNLAAGLIKPNIGNVTFNGQDLSKMNDNQLSDIRSQKMGFIFQFPSLIPSLSILENISLPSIFINKGKQTNFKRASELLQIVGLTEKSSVSPNQLSAGEQKRVAIARALINNPHIVLADEPTSDLDEYTEKQIMQMLQNINASGVTFLIVTHSLQLLPLATRAFEMRDGNLNPIDLAFTKKTSSQSQQWSNQVGEKFNPPSPED